MKKVLIVGIVFATVCVSGVRAETRVEFKELRKQTNEEFRVKLQTIKDEKRKQTVTRLNNQLCEIQKRRVEVMKKSIEVMGKVLVKLDTKLAGKSNDSVVSAKKAHQEAKTAVEGLSVRSCGVTLSGDETKVRSEVTAARVALEADVKAVHAKIRDARKATTEAVKSVAKMLNEKI